MPKVLKNLEGRGKAFYDWKTIFDGQAREFAKGTDFATPAQDFASVAHTARRRMGVEAKIVLNSKDQTVSIQATSKLKPLPKPKKSLVASTKKKAAKKPTKKKAKAK